MASSRDDSHQPLPGESQDVPATVKTEPDVSSDTATAGAQKRKEPPTDEDNAGKRRQLTPPDENGAAAIKQDSPPAQEIKPEEIETEANGTSTPTNHDNLVQMSRTLLKTFTHSTFDYLTQIVSRPKSPKGLQYRALYERFKTARERLPIDNNFVVISDGQPPPGTYAFIRRVNVVTFTASMLGSRDASFRQLNTHFLTTFVKPSEPLTQKHVDIWLGLKTQAYISQAIGATTDMDEVLNHLFPEDMQSTLGQLQVDETKEAGVKPNIVQQFTDRRRDLSTHVTLEQVTALRQKYQWNKVLHKMMDLIKRLFPELTEVPENQIQSLNEDGERQEDITEPAAPQTNQPVTPNGMTTNAPGSSSVASMNNSNQPHNTQAGSYQPYQSGIATSGGVADQTLDLGLDPLAAADQAAMDLVRRLGMAQPNQAAPQLNPQQPGPSTAIPQQYVLPNGDQQNSQMVNSYLPAQQLPPQGYEAGGNPTNHSGYQPQQTARIYEQARQATNGRSTQASSSSSPRRPAGQSQRRPWSQEEENALMTGLDQVKGPHWSMILSLYGANGKYSEVLKDRNQVQLKDKARNLKLWFLKSGTTVPESLRCVTGELKTRAPASVRNAAQQQAAMNASHSQPSPVTQSHSPQNYQAMVAPGPYTATANQGVYAANTPPVTTAGSSYNAYVPVDAPNDDNNWLAMADSAAAAVLAEEDLQRLLQATEDNDTTAAAPETADPANADSLDQSNGAATSGEVGAETAAETNPVEDAEAGAEAGAGDGAPTEGEPLSFEWDDAAMEAAASAAAAIGAEGFGDS